MYQGGSWLELNLSDIPLEGGKFYGFLLSFKSTKPVAQVIVFSLAKNDVYAEGQSLYSEDGTDWKVQSAFHFEVLGAAVPGAMSVPPTIVAPVTEVAPLPMIARRVLGVDRGGTAEFKSLRAAAAIAKAGDTIRLKPNSGSYREELYIPASGTQENPIIFEGAGNLITGFEPIFKRPKIPLLCAMALCRRVGNSRHAASRSKF